MIATLRLRNAQRGISNSAVAVTLPLSVRGICLPVYSFILNVYTLLPYLSLRTLDCCFHAGP